MDLLLYLSDHAGSVAQKDELLKVVWGDACVTDDVLTRCVFELRKALGDSPRLPRYIETVPKRGYRLIATVAEASERVAQVGTPRTRRWMFLKTASVLGVAVIMAVLLGSNRLRKSRAMSASVLPVGILLIDLYDPAKKQMIWRGDASKTIDLNKNPDKNYKNMQKAMAKLFKNYPPRPDK
jgi:hypothetical protein